MVPDLRFHGGKIIERQHESVLQDVLRSTCGPRDGNEVLGLPLGRSVGDQELVDASMVLTLELRNHGALPICPRNSDRVNRRFRAGDGEPNLTVWPKDFQ